MRSSYCREDRNRNIARPDDSLTCWIAASAMLAPDKPAIPAGLAFSDVWPSLLRQTFVVLETRFGVLLGFGEQLACQLRVLAL